MNDNIFKNAENRVVSHSFMKKDLKVIDQISDATLGNQALKKIAIRESASLEALEQKKEEKYREQQKNFQSVVEASLSDTKKTLGVNHWFKDMKVKLFKDIVFEVYYNALPLDADFLPKVESSIRKTVDEYIDNNGGFALLESAIEATDSNFLKRVKSCCESVAREACNSRLKEDGFKDTITFELTDDEFDYFKKAKNDLDIERISQLVKDKVLTVIKDEKERETKEAEVIKDIEDELTNDENVVDDATLDEAYQRIVLNKLPVHEATLFNSLMRSSYEELLKENMALMSAHENEMDNEDDFNLTYDVDFDDDDAIDFDDEHIDDEVAHVEDDETINNDLHLAESALIEEFEELLEGEQADAYRKRKENERHDKEYKENSRLNNREYNKYKREINTPGYKDTDDDREIVRRREKNDAKFVHDLRTSDKGRDALAANKRVDKNIKRTGDINTSLDLMYNDKRAKDMSKKLAYAKDAHERHERRHPKKEGFLDMDKVFAETVAKYTLMETLYTIKLENYKYNDIRKLTEAMLNPKKIPFLNKSTKVDVTNLSVNEYKDIHNKISKAANRVFSQLQFKDAFKVDMAKTNINSFKNDGAIDFIKFNVYPISKKHKIDPRDFGTADGNKELNKNFNSEFKNISKLMSNELKTAGIKFKKVDYSGDWDTGYFTVYFK